MRAIVVDASVAAKWFLPETDSDIAEGVLSSKADIHAPELLRIEVANAFWKHIIAKSLSLADWEFARPRLERSVTRWHADEPLLPEALRMASDVAHPVYDFIYLALARKLGVPLLTADRRFMGKAPDGFLVRLEKWRG